MSAIYKRHRERQRCRQGWCRGGGGSMETIRQKPQAGEHRREGHHVRCGGRGEEVHAGGSKAHIHRDAGTQSARERQSTDGRSSGRGECRRVHGRVHSARDTPNGRGGSKEPERVVWCRMDAIRAVRKHTGAITQVRWVHSHLEPAQGGARMAQTAKKQTNTGTRRQLARGTNRRHLNAHVERPRAGQGHRI